jgi:hypothetical protein
MPDISRGRWLDDSAGRLIRPYTISDGRTKPTREFDLMTMVGATGIAPDDYLGPDHAQVLELCRTPLTVAEVAARTRIPVTVTKVLLSDLVESGAIATRTVAGGDGWSDPNNPELLEAVLNGLRSLV